MKRPLRAVDFSYALGFEHKTRRCSSLPRSLRGEPETGEWRAGHPRSREGEGSICGLRRLPREGNSDYDITSRGDYRYGCSDACWRRQGCEAAAGPKTSAPGACRSDALAGALGSAAPRGCRLSGPFAGGILSEERLPS